MTNMSSACQSLGSAQSYWDWRATSGTEVVARGHAMLLIVITMMRFVSEQSVGSCAYKTPTPALRSGLARHGKHFSAGLHIHTLPVPYTKLSANSHVEGIHSGMRRR
jgi:hypothetical protein